MSSARWRRARRRGGRDERPGFVRVDFALRDGEKNRLRGLSGFERAHALMRLAGADHGVVAHDMTTDPIVFSVITPKGRFEMSLPAKDYSPEEVAAVVARWDDLPTKRGTAH
jgi:hypothetical protein